MNWVDSELRVTGGALIWLEAFDETPVRAFIACWC